jgi:hypothetical protein
MGAILLARLLIQQTHDLGKSDAAGEELRFVPAGFGIQRVGHE